MIPIKLTLEGFTSYRNKQSVDFTEFEIACVSGANGAGKSSLLDAITFALYGKARKNDEAIINSACPKASVILDFQYEQATYRVARSITRGKGGQVDFFIYNPELENWKTLSERTASETNAKIEKTLRLDYETFINASFFLQGKADSFAMKKPSERKQILASILGLDEWERYREFAREKRSQQESELALNKSKLDECQAEIGEEPKRQQELAELEKEKAEAHTRLVELQLLRAKQQSEETRLKAQRDTLERLKQLLAKAESDQAESIDLIARRNEQLKACQTELERAPQVKADYETYKTMRQTLEASDALQDQVRPIEDQRRDLIAQIEKEKAVLNSKLQILENEAGRLQTERAQIKALENQNTGIEVELDALEKQVQRRPTLEAELAALQEKAGTLQAELGQIENKGRELNERMAKLDQVQGAVCPLCGQSLSEHDRETLIEELESERNASRELYTSKQTERSQTLRALEAGRTELQEIAKLEGRLNSGRVQSEGLLRRIEALEKNQTDWQAGKAAEMESLCAQLGSGNLLPEVTVQVKGLEAELAKFGYDLGRHAELRQKVKANESIEAQVHHLEIAANDVKNHQDALKELEARLKKQEKESEKITQEHDELAAKVAVDSAGLTDGRQIELELQQAQEAEARVLRFLGGAQQRLKAIDVQRERYKDLLAEAGEICKEIDRLKQLEKAFGKDGVPALLIEQALPELQENADDILKRLTNDAMTVYFATQRDYKDNKRKDKQDTLDILISDGGSTRDYETYSGGEAFRVNFAIRLALSHVLAHRAGARLQTLVIDEGFGNQDAEGRDKLIQAINEVSNDFAKVLVITHLDELKDIFSTRIEVSKTLEGSEVRVVQS
jgi:exonuclease SbcC